MPGNDSPTPIAIIVYNRPDMTQRVLEAISFFQPTKLFVVADGPKNTQDNDLCQQTRALIDGIDWDCKIFKNYANSNMGCGLRVSSGISWAFESCDRAIILEDDCVPNPSFFPYCEELLERYNSDERIGIISGDSFIDASDIEESYYFSNFPHTWGWATWKRTWDNFDLHLKNWPTIRNTGLLLDKTRSEYYSKKWNEIFENMYESRIDTWDYQLVYMLWKQNQLSIVPKVNLVSNIGFGIQSTHTKNPNDKLSCIPTSEMKFPLTHPKSISINIEKDNDDLIYSFGPMPARFSGSKKRIMKYIRDIFT